MMYTEEIQRFQTALNTVADELDKAHLRELQADSHQCAATCCRDKGLSTSEVLQCVENCGERLQMAKQIVLEELDRLDDKFERCVSSCREYIRESGENGSEAHTSAMMDGCVKRCVDTNIDIIPELMKAINRALSKGQ